MDNSHDTEPRVLIVDDDTGLCEMLGRYLETEGFSVSTVHDGQTGLEVCLEGAHDVIVLDVMLPRLNGIEVLRQLRAKSQTPVLMLTARGEDIDRIIGLEIGADDYLPKPCNPRELVARIRAILRRSLQIKSNLVNSISAEKIKIDDLLIDTGSRTASRHGQSLHLTGAEYAVLELLSRNVGHVVSKDELTEYALGRKLSPYDRSIETHIGHLRKKLGPSPDGAQRIRTERGKGYFLVLK